MVTGRTISLLGLLALLVALGVMFYQLMAPFLLPLFLAAVTAIVAQPLHAWMLTKCGQRRSIAAGSTTAILVSAVLLPALVITVLSAFQLVGFVQQVLSVEAINKQQAWQDHVVPMLETVASWVPNYTVDQLQADAIANLKSLADRLSGNTIKLASSTVGATITLLVATSVFLVALYYFLADGPALAAGVRDLIPVDKEQQSRMVTEFTKVTRAVVTATILAAIVQGFMTAVALYFLDFGHFLVFLVIATIAAMIPMVGAWMVWLPCAILLAMQGHWGAAIGLTLYGSLGVSLADNVVRMYVLNTDAQLHPLLALVSVLGALDVFGLWGIFIGPIIASCFTAALQIFNQEVHTLAAEHRHSVETAAKASSPVATK